MLVVKDAMVLINLTKMSLLQQSCASFESVLIPDAVYDEVLKGEERYPHEVHQVRDAIKQKQMRVATIRDKNLIIKANMFNVYRGESAAVALYWQEGADVLATDDDNVRRKRDALKVNVIGTPAIVITLLRNKSIDRNAYMKAVKKLREIGWFSSTVFDKMLMEMDND